MPLDPRAARLLRMLAASDGSGADRLGAEDRRRDLQALAAGFGGEPPPAQTRNLTLPGQGGDIPVRRYDAPASPSAFPEPGAPPGGAVAYLHGGGWVAGGLDTHDGVCRRLARASGAPVFAVDYRLAPEHPFPAGLDDAEAAVRGLLARAAALGFDPARLVLAGDSAGANLAAAVCGRLRDLSPPVRLLVLICPILDVAAKSPSRRAYGEGFFLRAEAMARDLQGYAGDVDLAGPELSPLRAALAGLPPVRVHVAEYDPFRDEGVAYVHALRAAGVEARLTEHAGQIHYFYALPAALPRAEAALAEIGREVREALG